MLQRSAYTNNWQTRNRRWRNIGLLWFNGISTKLSHRLTVEGHSKRTENKFAVTIIKLYASHYQFQISGLTPGSYWREQWASWLKKHENLVWICCLFVHLKKEQYAFVYKINSMHRDVFSNSLHSCLLQQNNHVVIRFCIVSFTLQTIVVLITKS